MGAVVKVHGLSLRTKLTIPMVVVCGAVSIFLVVLVPAQISSVGHHWMQRRATDMSRVLADAAAPGVDMEDEQGLAQYLELAGAAPGVLYAVAKKSDGKRLAAWHWREEYAVELPPLSGDEPVVEARGRILHVVAPIKWRDATVGALEMGFSLDEIHEQQNRTFLLVVLISIGLFVIGLAIAIGIAGAVADPVRRLTTITGRIVEQGDLTQRVAVTTGDEVGLLAHTFEQLVEKLRVIPRTLRDIVGGVQQVTDQLSSTATVVSAGSTLVRGRVTESSAAMVRMAAALRGIGNRVDSLHRSAQNTSESNQAMVELTRRVTENIHGLVASVTAADGAIKEVTASVREMAGNIGELNASVEESSAAMVQMETAIGHVDESTQQTASLSERVTADAQAGTETLAQTIAGINRIRDATHTVSSVMDRLGEHIADIGSILDVISGVAAQTNLLALNAAIIASQAGEQGRAFGVVADEIKALAQRTSSSTKEIAALIESVRGESEKARNAMAQSLMAVDEGVGLGNRTTSALQQILDSAALATKMAKAIAVATSEQSQAAKRAAHSSQRIAGSIQEISGVSASQAKRCDEVISLTRQMREMTDQVMRSSEEQAQSSAAIARSIDEIKQMVTQIHGSQREQTKSAEETLGAVKAIEAVAEEQGTSVHELDQALKLLREHATALQGAVQQFRA
jgi:methyl-accepting chemotaxis protein